MAQSPIEILTAGDLPDDHLERAITAANTLHSEFSYSLFPEEAQADFRAALEQAKEAFLGRVRRK